MKNQLKKVLSLMLAVLTLVCIIPMHNDAKAASTNPFVDVTSSDEAIMWAYRNGITNGKDSTHFSPDAVCTRGQIVTFLWRAFGCPEHKPIFNPFSDVVEGRYYYDAVLWAVEKGITNGTDKTHFSPDKACTRAQAITFLWRAFGKETDNKWGLMTPILLDCESGAFYYNATLWAKAKGMVLGSYFYPNANCTRRAFVSFLYKACVYKAKGNEITDITSTAYFEGEYLPYRIVIVDPKDNPNSDLNFSGVDSKIDAKVTSKGDANKKNFITSFGNCILHFVTGVAGEAVNAIQLVNDVGITVYEAFKTLGGSNVKEDTQITTNVQSAAVMTATKSILYVYVKYRGVWCLAQKSDRVLGDLTIINKISKTTYVGLEQSIITSYSKGNHDFNLKNCMQRAKKAGLSQLNKDDYIKAANNTIYSSKFKILDSIAFTPTYHEKKYSWNYGVKYFPNDGSVIWEFDDNGVVYEYIAR